MAKPITLDLNPDTAKMLRVGVDETAPFTLFRDAPAAPRGSFYCTCDSRTFCSFGKPASTARCAYAVKR